MAKHLYNVQFINTCTLLNCHIEIIWPDVDTEESNKTATDTAEDVSSNTCEHSPNYSTGKLPL